MSVYLYAAMRPRFGPGPKTAVIAAITVWLLAYVAASMIMTELGVFTSAQAITGALWGLGEACVATIAGAWVYREP